MAALLLAPQILSAQDNSSVQQHINTAYALNEAGKPLKALDLLLDVQNDLAVADSSSAYPKLLYTTAALLERNGLLNEALVYYQRSLQIYKNAGTELGDSLIYKMTFLYQYQKRLEDAAELIETYPEFYKSEKAQALAILANQYFLTRQENAFLSLVDRAPKTMSDSEWYSLYLLTKARFYVDQQRWKPAGAILKTYESRFNALKDTNPLFFLSYLTARSTWQTGVGQHRPALKSMQELSIASQGLFDRQVMHKFYQDEETHRVQLVEDKAKLKEEVLLKEIEVEKAENRFVLIIAAFLFLVVFGLIYEIRQRRLFTKKLEGKNLEISTQKAALTEQAEKLKQINEEISQINENLENIVKDRSAQLLKQNSMLEEYAFINSHKLRAPVARIKGLAQLVDISEDLDEKHTIIEKIMFEIDDLDNLVGIIRNALDGQKELDRTMFL